MFITTADGTRINLSLVKYFDVGDLNQSGFVGCRFEFNDGTGSTGAISPETLALIDATFTHHRN
ncbi:hypothetical protein [Bosea sp. 2RAB26]|uniref:hypothetical protein n=1 Tax=Bosea sp. 2RAB26 TaxID=3237476 RepID=UPI003F9147A7